MNQKTSLQKISQHSGYLCDLLDGFSVEVMVERENSTGSSMCFNKLQDNLASSDRDNFKLNAQHKRLSRLVTDP